MLIVMKKAIDLDDDLRNESDEKLESLLVENRSLRELLQIKKNIMIIIIVLLKI
jgi:hypothetical protein